MQRSVSSINHHSCNQVIVDPFVINDGEVGLVAINIWTGETALSSFPREGTASAETCIPRM